MARQQPRSADDASGLVRCFASTFHAHATTLLGFGWLTCLDSNLGVDGGVSVVDKRNASACNGLPHVFFFISSGFVIPVFSSGLVFVISFISNATVFLLRLGVYRFRRHHYHHNQSPQPLPDPWPRR